VGDKPGNTSGDIFRKAAYWRALVGARAVSVPPVLFAKQDRDERSCCMNNNERRLGDRQEPGRKGEGRAVNQLRY
jgi:hypothetical protein